MISLYDMAIYLGIYQLTWWFYRTMCLVWRSLAGAKCTTERYRPMDANGSWAVITGGTGRMGKTIAKHLVKEGFNIVLISKTLSKLN